MLRQVNYLLGFVLLFFVAEAVSEKFVPLIYKRPIERPTTPRITRVRRDNSEPLWLYQGNDVQRAPASGDHPHLPPYIDDVKLVPNRRYARSLDSPSAKRGGGSHSTSSGSRDTGATHPGHNRRNARSVSQNLYLPEPIYSPTFPKPGDLIFPTPRKPTRSPLLPRYRRDLQPSLQKPTHYDILVPGWNPNARVHPWQKIKVRTGRDVSHVDQNDNIEESDDSYGLFY